jgi:hypothetical protein
MNAHENSMICMAFEYIIHVEVILYLLYSLPNCCQSIEIHESPAQISVDDFLLVF